MTLKWNGLEIRITFPEGSVRTGKDKQGQPWSQRMPFSYGYIVGTKGTDQEGVDVILAEDERPDATVFVAVLPKNREGEDKVLLGFPSERAAKAAFISCYGGDASFLKKIYPLTIRQLKKKLKSRRGLNLMANYNTAPFGMNNYIVEYSPTADLGEDTIEKYKDDSPEDKKYSKKLLPRQGKPEVVETTLGTNVNDNLNSYIFGSTQRR